MKRFGKPFKNTGDSLAHGRQEDFTDCGMLTANTAAHNIFNDELWTKDRKNVERARWFITLSEAHIKEVHTK